MRTFVIIPARGGSKGVPGKNIKLLAGYPLIAYSVVLARQCQQVERVIVSTDDPQIAGIARQFGAEVPFMRPAQLATDTSTDREFIIHALDWLRDHEGSEPELLVHLRPTTPLRHLEKVDEAIQAIRMCKEATSLRSAHQLPEPPQKMLGIDGNFFVGLFPHDPRPDYFNLPRQLFPPAFHPNGYVDVWRVSHVRSSSSLAGDKVLAFVTPFTYEIDNAEDFDLIEFHVERYGHPLLEQLRATFPNLEPE